MVAKAASGIDVQGEPRIVNRPQQMSGRQDLREAVVHCEAAEFRNKSATNRPLEISISVRAAHTPQKSAEELGVAARQRTLLGHRVENRLKALPKDLLTEFSMPRYHDGVEHRPAEICIA
jgi:hypothetical protein